MNGFSQVPASEAGRGDEPGAGIKFLEQRNSASRREGLEHSFAIFGLCCGFEGMVNVCGSLGKH